MNKKTAEHTTNSTERAPFIVIEGIDGAGTTTQSSLLFERLRSEGRPVWLTSEPTDGPVGRLLREVLSGRQSVTPETTAHLFAADRHEHLFGAGGIVERLDSGTVVLCDRYKYSSLAYQGVSADPDLVRKLNNGFPAPDAIIYVDLPPAVGDKRLAGRSSREIYERLDIQNRVYEQYNTEIERARLETAVIRVDGTLDPEILLSKIHGALVEQSIL
jgi:dTMP kinase